MDEMKIGSKFIRDVISKLIKMLLRKKLGYNVNIQLNELSATIIDGKSHVHLSVDAELEKNELVNILKIIGLD
jgi:hypothetical protein